MIGSHPSFIQPSNAQIKLWRYMDISKFLALIQTEKLYFARADNLGDPFEGSMPRGNAEFEESIVKRRDSDPDLAPFKNLPQEKVIEIFHTLSTHRKKFREEMYVSCWHMNEHESAAMWKIYSQADESVCIQTTYEKLAELLPDWIKMGVVEYIDYDVGVIGVDNLFNPFLQKRRSFEHEREVRAIVWSALGETVGGAEARGSILHGGAQVQMDLSSLIECVCVSPTSPNWFKQIVENVSHRYGLNTPVRQSQLLASPLF